MSGFRSFSFRFFASFCIDQISHEQHIEVKLLMPAGREFSTMPSCGDYKQELESKNKTLGFWYKLNPSFGNFAFMDTFDDSNEIEFIFRTI